LYRLKVDHEDYLGKFKSSGLLVSTGTGSTGWLYSAKKYSELDVSRALKKLGAHEEPQAVCVHLADHLSKETVFPGDAKKMYYYVREPTYNSIKNDEFESHS